MEMDQKEFSKDIEFQDLTSQELADPEDQEKDKEKAAKRRSHRKSEEHTEFQILNDFSALNLLIPIREWTDRTWAWRRTVFRLIVLAVTLIVIAAIVFLSAFFSFAPKTVIRSIPITAPKLNFQLDGCFLDIYPDSLPATDTMYKISVVLLSIDGIVITTNEEGLVSVVDSRPIGRRYTHNECVVKFFIPEGITLPQVEIQGMGFKDSSIYSTGLNLGANSLKVSLENPSQTSIYVNISQFIISGVEASFERGTLNLRNGELRGDSQINIGKGNLFLQVSHNINFVSIGIPDSHHCLSGNSVICSGNLTCSISGVNSSPSPQVQVISTADPTLAGFVQISAAQGASALYPVASSDINISAFQLQLLQSTATASKDTFEVTVRGPGTPLGTWIFSKVMFYVTVPKSFLDVFTWGLLTPKSAQSTVTLQPSFCPGLDFPESKFDYTIATGEILQNSVGNTAGSNLVFRQSDGIVFHNNLQLKRDTYSGTYFLEEVTIQTHPVAYVTLIFNASVSILGAVYVVFVLGKKFFAWKNRNLQDWGMARFGDEEWEKRKRTIKDRAGVFFLSEFIIGFPKQNRGYLRMIGTVWLHIILILMPVIPIFLAALLYNLSANILPQDILANDLRSPAYLRHLVCEAPFDNSCYATTTAAGYILPIIVYVIVLLVVFVGLIALICYYNDIADSQIVRLLRRAYTYTNMFFCALSLAYLVNVSFWIILGCIISPNTILPISAIFLVLTFHFFSTISRVKTLHSQLSSNLQENFSQVEQTPPPLEKLSISNVQKFSTSDVLSVVTKSRILELTGLTIWEKIWQEVVIFFVMLFFFIFICAGFLSLSPMTEFISALTTGIVFLVGGGVNIPLNQQSQADDERKKWIESIREQAQKDISQSKKDV